jgi:hypothetical protein
VHMKSKFAVCLVLIFSCNALLVGQNTTSSWKEYVYPNDGFAVTLPSSPTPHKDLQLPNMTVYTVRFSNEAGMSLRISDEKRQCATTIASLKEGALRGSHAAEKVDSLREFSKNGYPGIDIESAVSSRIKRYERYCVNGKFYIFVATWPLGDGRPTGMTRVVDSFRLLNPPEKN